MNNSIHSEKCGYIPGIYLCCHVIKNIEEKIKYFPNIFDKINNINDTELINYIGNKNNIKISYSILLSNMILTLKNIIIIELIC